MIGVESDQAPHAVNQAVAVLLTVPEVCAALKIGRAQLYQLINARKLDTVKIGRSRRIPTSAVEELIERLRAEGTP